MMHNYSNLDIKLYAEKHKVTEKEVAKELGIGYSTLLTIWLRKPLTDKYKNRFKKAVNKIAFKREHPLSYKKQAIEYKSLLKECADKFDDLCSDQWSDDLYTKCIGIDKKVHKEIGTKPNIDIN